jgi:hypothetical protein
MCLSKIFSMSFENLSIEFTDGIAVVTIRREKR